LATLVYSEQQLGGSVPWYICICCIAE